jgi:hypothetical protein
VKLAAFVQGIVTLPKRPWLLVPALAVSCGVAVAAAWAVGAPEPVRSSPAVTPAQPAAPAVTASAPEPVASEVPAAGEPRRFLPETRDESVVLDVSSQGCFGGAGPHRFEIRGENPGAVRVLDPGTGAVLREDALDAETRRELERTIAFHRAPPGDVVCSTVDVIRISFRQGDREVWSETYEDSTCETDYRGAPWSLAGLFDPERQAERRAGRDERLSREPVD